MIGSAEVRRRGRTIAALLGLAGWISACAPVPLGPPVPSLANIRQVREGRLAPLALGEFHPGAGQETGVVEHSLRGVRIVAPQGGFAGYLRQTLEAELSAAGALDASAVTVLSGTLLASRLDAAIGQGSGSLGARFVVTRDGHVRYDRALTVDASWPSSFIGIEAVPAAIHAYSSLSRKLVASLLADPDFRRAVAP